MRLSNYKDILKLAKEAKPLRIYQISRMIMSAFHRKQAKQFNINRIANIPRILRILTSVVHGKVNVAVWLPYIEDFIKLTKDPVTVSGVWGNSGKAKGTLEFIQCADQLNEQHKMDNHPDVTGSILVYSSQLNRDMLAYAIKVHALGIIAPSIALDILEIAYQGEIPIIQMEGFGEMSFSDSTSRILSKLKGLEIDLYANVYSPANDRLPYIAQNYSNQHNVRSINLPSQNLKRIWHTFSTVISSIGILN